MIRVVLPAHLRTLAKANSEVTVEVAGTATIGSVLDALEASYPMLANSEVTVEVAGTATIGSVLDALEASYPMLQGTIRDHVSKQRRPFVRFFACAEDLSHDSADAPLPEAVVSGTEPFLIVGAIAGG